MSGLAPLRGHDELRASLARAVATGDLPGSILLHGPAGVGKQRIGLWLAQRILCTAPSDVEPCGECSACRLVVRLEHPDVHWFFPVARPKGSSGPEKLAEALEEVRAAELAARRAEPYRVATPGEPVGYYLATIHTVRKLASSRPAAGPRSIFLIGDAELLVPQESSQEAANALLKLLEEPPPSAVFILTASDPDSLLPTIRSRLLGIRVRGLPEEEVRRFLSEERGADAAGAELAARLGQGAIGRALGFLPDDGDPGPFEELRLQARAFVAAAVDPAAAGRLSLAHGLAPSAARGAFSDILDHLLVWLRDLGAVAAGAEEAVINVDALGYLRDLARRLPNGAAGVPDAVRAIEKARELARGNVNPQLVTASMLRSMHAALADG